MLKIRILAITPFPPILNGGSLASLNLVSRLAKKHSVIVLTYQNSYIDIENVVIHAANLGQQASIFRGAFFILFSIILGCYYAIRSKPDVIYAKNMMSPGIAATVISKLFRIPLVQHSSGPDVENPEMNLDEMGSLGRVISKIIRKILKFEIDTSSIIIANCFEDIKAIDNWKPSKPTVLIYNGVDTKKFKPVSLQTKRKMRKKLGINHDKPIIITVANPRKEKRLDRIIKLAAELENDFIFVGPSQKDLNDFGDIPNNCKAVGMIRNVDEYLKASDIFILTSIGEGLSNAMLEALSVGMPVISTGVGEAKRLLNHLGLGFLADSHEDRREIVTHLIENPEERKSVGKSARNYIENNHNWIDTTRDVEKILEKALFSR